MRRALLPASILALGLAGCRDAAPRRVEPPRNAILISIDTLRADHVGAYGYLRDTTPNLDRLAQGGIRFARGVAQGGDTTTSHGALLTSRYYGSYTGSPQLTGPPQWVETVAELLKERGFVTGGFVDGGRMNRAFGFAQGFDHYEDSRVGLARILRRAERWIDANRAERFFLFLHCYDVHTPYGGRPPFDTMFEDPAYRGRVRANAGTLARANAGKLRLSEGDLRHIVARYDGGIRHVDTELGGFLAWLEQRGLASSTAVVVTADHGEEFREHGRLMHWQLYYFPNLHVPLLFRVPGLAPRVVEDVVELIDVVPTLLELLGTAPHAAAMGRSLVPLMEGREDGGEGRIAFAESGGGLPWQTAVTRDHQLLLNTRTGKRRLFDLRADPREQTDVADREPEVTVRLMAALRSKIEELRRRNTGPPGEAPVLGAKTREELRALGYVGD